MFCSKCGKDIDDQAVVCIHCGVPTQNFQPNQQQNSPPPQAAPIIINNSASASASASVNVKKKRSLLFDIFMICITGGLWIIWMIVRPKY